MLAEAEEAEAHQGETFAAVEEEPYYDNEQIDVDDEAALVALAQEGDEDASLILNVESAIIDAVQEHGDLAPAFISYQEARGRLRAKSRSRGFWPPKGKGKGGKGKETK